MFFSPSLWGSGAWKFFHMVALSFPDQPTTDDKNDFKTFFHLLKNVLPCGKCRNNFNRHIKEIPIDKYLDSPNHLFEWVVKLQNVVTSEYGGALINKEQKKQEYLQANGVGYKETFVSSIFGNNPQIKIIITLLIITIGVFLLSKFLPKYL